VQGVELPVPYNLLISGVTACMDIQQVARSERKFMHRARFHVVIPVFERSNAAGLFGSAKLELSCRVDHTGRLIGRGSFNHGPLDLLI